MFSIPAYAPDDVPPISKTPGAGLSINQLMTIVAKSKNYNEFISQLTKSQPPESHGLFFALHGDRTVTSRTPQVVMHFGNMTLAYAPQAYAEIFYSIGDETVHFQFVELPNNGGISINAFQFAASGVKKPSPEHAITPQQVMQMHARDLIETTNRYATVGCVRCHLTNNRRMVEADNHGRRFLADSEWVFADPAKQAEVHGTLQSLFDDFSNSESTRNSPVYGWLWEQPQVKARGGEIRPEDTFTYDNLVRSLITINGHEMLGELKEHRNWPEYQEAFQAAVNGDNKKLRAILNTKGVTDRKFASDLQRIKLKQAEMNLKLFRNRNNDNIAWILARGDRDLVEKNKNNNYLLLNRHSIEKIGPGILRMVVTEEEWKRLTPAQREKKVRLSELAVKDSNDLLELVTSEKVLSTSNRRAATHMVLTRLVGTEKKAIPYLSCNVAFKIDDVGCETGGKGVDIMDIYADALVNPRSFPIKNPTSDAEAEAIRAFLCEEGVAQLKK